MIFFSENLRCGAAQACPNQTRKCTTSALFTGLKKPSKYGGFTRRFWSGSRALESTASRSRGNAHWRAPVKLTSEPGSEPAATAIEGHAWTNEEVENHQRVGRIIQCEAERHRGHVARPFAEQGMPAAVREGEAAIEQPRRGRRAQERKQARDVRVRVGLARPAIARCRRPRRSRSRRRRRTRKAPGECASTSALRSPNIAPHRTRHPAARSRRAR